MRSGGDSDAGSLLRTRGGISDVEVVLNGSPVSSPHTRRYFPGAVAMALVWRLFSAHAEVFPRIDPGLSTNRPLLRTRGGISLERWQWLWYGASSPHTRRYFQKSTLG